MSIHDRNPSKDGFNIDESLQNDLMKSSLPNRKTSFGTYTMRPTKNNNLFEFKTKLN